MQSIADVQRICASVRAIGLSRGGAQLNKHVTVCEPALCRFDNFFGVWLFWLRKRCYSHCCRMIGFSSVLGDDFGHSARGSVC